MDVVIRAPAAPSHVYEHVLLCLGYHFCWSVHNTTNALLVTDVLTAGLASDQWKATPISSTVTKRHASLTWLSSRRKIDPRQICCGALHSTVVAVVIPGLLHSYLSCWKAWKEHETDAKQLTEMEPLLETKRQLILNSGCVNNFNIAEGIGSAIQTLHRCRCFLRNFEVAMFYFEPGSTEEVY